MEMQSRTEWPQFPFCSPRCRLIDLGRWLDGSYRLPAEEPEPAEEDAETDTP
jgi:endogenous inhibitor of DNA gyrase (YacG/DUF329 family)